MYYDEIGIPTRQISAENPTGEKGGACALSPDPGLPFSRASEHLGKGFKVNPFIKVNPHETVTLGDIRGSGSIREFFFTTDFKRLSELVLRIYWDDEEPRPRNVPTAHSTRWGMTTTITLSHPFPSMSFPARV